VLKNILIGRKLYCFIGLGGVHPEESPQARAFGKIFTYALLIIAIALLFEWQLQKIGVTDSQGWRLFNWVVWLFFVTEFTVLLLMIKNKQRFVRENWLLPVIIIAGLPFLMNLTGAMIFFRMLRPLLAIVLMVPALGLLMRFFIDGRLMTTIFAAIIIVVFFGVLVAGVDPNIHNAWDGIWWALATVSTVGYGDVVPVTFLGRVIGGILVILGLGIFVVITANFLAIILREEVTGVKREEREVANILKEVHQLRKEQQELMQHMIDLKKRLDQSIK